MSEAEYEFILQAVSAAVAPTVQERFVVSRARVTSEAANDNDGAWPLPAFPDGWHAAC